MGFVCFDSVFRLTPLSANCHYEDFGAGPNSRISSQVGVCARARHILSLLCLRSGSDAEPRVVGWSRERSFNIDCWDAASLALVESQPQHQELFMKIARAFWKRYVKRVLSRTHGLGRRRSGVSGRYRQLWFWCPMSVFHVTKNCLFLLLLIVMIMIIMMMLFLCILSSLQSWLLIENDARFITHADLWVNLSWKENKCLI